MYWLGPVDWILEHAISYLYFVVPIWCFKDRIKMSTIWVFN